MIRKTRKHAHRVKHLTYFKLEQAVARQGCPICTLVQESVDGFFEAFLYEKVNDVGLRSRFNRDNGLCNRHVYQLLARHDGLSIAVLYRPLLEQVAHAVRSGEDAPSQSGRCLVCDGEREAEERYIGELVAFLDDDELRSSFAASSGLCLPHFEMARKAASPAAAWFVELHARQFDELLESVKRYIDAKNWSLGDARPALSADEERVWMGVVARYSGYRGMPNRSAAR